MLKHPLFSRLRASGNHRFHLWTKAKDAASKFIKLCFEIIASGNLTGTSFIPFCKDFRAVPVLTVMNEFLAEMVRMIGPWRALFKNFTCIEKHACAALFFVSFNKATSFFLRTRAMQVACHSDPFVLSTLVAT